MPNCCVYRGPQRAGAEVPCAQGTSRANGLVGAAVGGMIMAHRMRLYRVCAANCSRIAARCSFIRTSLTAQLSLSVANRESVLQ